MQRDRGPAGLPPAPSLDGFLHDDLRHRDADTGPREPQLFDDAETGRIAEARLPVPAPQMEITAPEADAERIALALMRSGRTEEAVSFLEQEIARTRDRAWKAGKLDVMRDITPDAEEIVIPPVAAAVPPAQPVDSPLRPRRSALDSSLNVRPSRDDDAAEDDVDGGLHAPYDPDRSRRPSRTGRMMMALALGVGVAGAAFLLVGPPRANLVAATEPVTSDDVTTGSVQTAAVEPVVAASPKPSKGAAEPVEAASDVVDDALQTSGDDTPPAEDVAAADLPSAPPLAADEPASGLAALAEPAAPAETISEPRLPRVRPAVTPDVQTASLQPRPLGSIAEIPAPQPAVPSDVPWSYDRQPAQDETPTYGAAVSGAAPGYQLDPQRVLTPQEHEELLMRRRLAENYAAERRREDVDDDDQIVIFEPYNGPVEPRRLPLGPIRRIWGN